MTPNPATLFHSTLTLLPSSSKSIISISIQACLTNNTICLKVVKLCLLFSFPLLVVNFVLTPMVQIWVKWKDSVPGLSIFFSSFVGIVFSSTFFDIALFFLLLMNTLHNFNKKTINSFNYNNAFFFYTNLVNICLYFLISIYYIVAYDTYFQAFSTIVYIFIFILPVYEINTYTFKYRRFTVEDIFRTPNLMLLYIPVTSTTVSYLFLLMASGVIYFAFGFVVI